VHNELLARQKIPPKLVGKKIWKERYEDIASFERYLARNGVLIRKFFLHVSREEQRKRFLSRLEEPEKNWKFSLADARERECFDDYMGAYEDMIRHTATQDSPWFVVPADNKWFTRLVVAAAVVDALQGLNLDFPKVDEARRSELEAARVALEKEAAESGKKRAKGAR
jgi:polyphosphate kinase 2 (PPK2 family)